MPRQLVAHVLLIEGAEGLTLVDTGFGTADVADPSHRLGRSFVAMVGAKFSPHDTAIAQVKALGFDPTDVRDIVLTHLDLDHASGIGDFPDARVHVHSTELVAATELSTVKERQRYKTVQWSHGPNWVAHDTDGEDWFGFTSAKVVAEDVLMIPLHGHTRGHAGVAVRRPEGGWLLHAGDAYFSSGEKNTPRECPPGLRLFQTVVQTDKVARHANQARLRELHAAHSAEITMFSAHDLSELDALRG
jgi:glyoxylase-like metal-dependent hydrolase (beta-lactamase superfamily II)